jgi:hypothetical protein
MLEPMKVIRVDGRVKPSTFNEVFGKSIKTTSCVDTVRANEDFHRIQEEMREPLVRTK